MWSPRMDARWGPQLEGEFDFTLLFEQLMLTIVPGGIIILIIPRYLKSAIQSARRVRSGRLLWGKLATGLALLAVQSANLALWQNDSVFRSKIALAASSMSLLASISILGILYITHTYSLQPSSFLSVFLSFTMLSDIVIARSYFRRTGLGANGALQIAMIVLKLVLVVLEEVPKRSLFYDEQHRSSLSREGAAGFWNRATFFWVNSLMMLGFREDLTVEDLPSIGEEFDSVRLFDKFSPNWSRVNKNSSLALPIALLRTVPWELAKVILPRLIFVMLNFSQPFLLLRVVQVVNNGGIHDKAADPLIGATALVYFGTMISRALQAHYNYRAMTSVRGILLVAIFDKMQRLELDVLAESAAVTLMTADTKGVEEIVSLTYEFWSSSLQVGLGLWSLSLFIGKACVLMVIPGICSFAASHFVSKAISKARTNWNADIQERVSATSTVLAQIKSIKAMGISAVVSEYLQKKRETEIQTSMQDRHARLWMFAFAALGNAVTPVIVLGGAYFWTRAEDALTSAEVFTVLTIVAVAADPLIMILQAIMGWTVALASLARIQAFLTSEEYEDTRQESTAITETEPLSDDKAIAASQKSEFAVQTINAGFTAPLKGTVFQAINMKIPWGSQAVVRGPVNCGKSSLLRAIIGERSVTSGTVAVGTRRVAYCNQQPWVQNQTLQAAVIGMAKFVAELYRDVLHGCELDVDISQMPNGDQTMTGTGGCNLSGGQKQRLSLARAVYTQMDILVLDDVLSALDAQTASSIAERLFGPDGLCRRWRSTVIMTTNRPQCLKYADLVYTMDGEGRAELDSSNADPTTSLPDNAGSSASSEPEADPEQPSGELKKTQLPSIEAPETNAALQHSKTSHKSGDWSLYSYYLLPAGIFWVASWIVVMAIAALVEKMPMIFIRICAKLQFLAHLDLGFLLSRFSQDMTYTAQDLPIHFIQFTFIFFLVLIEVGIVAAGTTYVAPIILLILLALYIVQVFYLRTSRQLRRLELESSEKLIGHVTEASDGIEHIRSFGWIEEFRAQFHIIVNRSQKPYYLLFCIQRWLSLSLDFVTSVAAVVLTILSIYLPEKTSDNAIGLAMLTLVSFSTVATWCIKAWTNLETALGAVARIKAFCIGTPLEEDTTEGPQSAEDWPTNGEVTFSDVCASYTDEDGTVRLALDHVTFIIHPGDKVSITGRTGSGKSSIFLAILRLIDFNGHIAFDGRGSTAISRELLRSRCTTLTQDGVILKASVRFNMFPFQGSMPAEEDIVETLQSVELWQHVQRQGGLDANVVEMCFSPSQRQLFFVARAMLHQKTYNTRIILIDEATSAMSQESDRKIQNVMDEAFARCTVLQIAHHPDWLTNINVKISMEFGKMIRFQRRQHNGKWEASK
ncbi:hypothetical protein PWT90_03232 [Aphanocladium album]|nr:hypothetical protein PWT90_03232 [Aphanocladium album]